MRPQVRVLLIAGLLVLLILAWAAGMTAILLDVS